MKKIFISAIAINLSIFSLSWGKVTDFEGYLQSFTRDYGSLTEFDRKMLHNYIDPVLTAMAESQKLFGRTETEQLQIIDGWVNLKGSVLGPEQTFDLYKKYGTEDEQACENTAFTFLKVTFEDPVGAWVDLVRLYERIQKDWPEGEVHDGVTKEEALAAQMVKIIAAKKNLLKIVLANGWDRPESSPHFISFSCYVDIDYKDAEAQRVYNVTRLEAGATKIRDKDYHMDELQGGRGVHELRRNLRSLGAWLKTAKSFVDVGSELRAEVDSYNSGFSAIKDSGELYETLVNNFMATGMSQDEAEEKATEYCQIHNPGALTWRERAISYYATFRDSKLMDRIIEKIRSLTH